MGEMAIRFGVSDGTKRAATWKCWTYIGTGKHDVYLACRAIGGRLKASLHQSGRWHIALDKEFFEKEQTAFDDRSQSRFLDKWNPAEIAPGFILAFRIITPHSAVSCEIMPEDKDIHWIPVSSQESATEINIILTSPSTPVSGWPGMNSMGTELVAAFDLENNSRLWVVYRAIECPDFGLHQGKPIFFGGKTGADLTGKDLRILLFSHEPDGSRTIIDSRIAEQEN